MSCFAPLASLGVFIAAYCCLLVGTSSLGTPIKNCSLALNETGSTLVNTSEPNLLYYQIDTHNKTVSSLRYMWSLVATPTLLFTVTNSSVNKTCNESLSRMKWTPFSENQPQGSADIPGYKGKFAMALVFKSLYAFQDDKAGAENAFNVSELHDSTKYQEYPLDKLKWSFDEEKQLLNGTSEEEEDSFSWAIKVNIPTSGGRLGYFPKYQFTNTSTTFDFTLQNFNYSLIFNGEANNTRLAMEILLVHGPHTNNGTINNTFSVDDEYTPSVFRTYDYLFGDRDNPGFVQWKPICYLSKDRKSTMSQQANVVRGLGRVNVSLPQGLATALYGDGEGLNVTSLFVVFGTQGDDNNFKPNYLTWTAVLGYGHPLYDVISITVIITIAVGLGLPLALVAVGGVFVFIKKKPWQNIIRLVSGHSRSENGYTTLNNGDEK